MLSDRHKAIFVHNPKCAGTSIKNALHHNPGEWFFDDWHYSLEQLKKRAVLDTTDYFKFAVVRNPYDRLVSAFTYNIEKVMNPDDYHWRSYPLSYSVLKDFTDMWFESKTSWGGADLIRTFRAFMKSTQGNRLFEKGWPIHFRRQKDFFRFVDMDIVLRFEDLVGKDCLIHKVEEATGLKIMVPYLNMSGHPDYQEFYDANTMDKVKRLYRDDFLEFGYNIDMLG